MSGTGRAYQPTVLAWRIVLCVGYAMSGTASVFRARPCRVLHGATARLYKYSVCGTNILYGAIRADEAASAGILTEVSSYALLRDVRD
eukprot:3078541-Rhodomonas_salina.1